MTGRLKEGFRIGGNAKGSPFKRTDSLYGIKSYGREWGKRYLFKKVAETCGISAGTLYYYFRSKDDLILHINQWNMERLTSSLLALLEEHVREGRDSAEIILEVFKALNAAELRGRMHLYLINEAMSRNPDLLIPLRKSYRNWFDMIEKAFIRILPVEADREAIARGLVASLDGLIIQKILNIDDVPLERIVKVETKGYGG